jgi:DNA-binding CsgD family transcriptional regulator
MNHLFFFLNFFFLLGGASGLTLAILIYLRFKNSLIVWYILALACWMANQVVDLVHLYLNGILGVVDDLLNAAMDDAAFFTIGLFAYLWYKLAFELFRVEKNRLLTLVFRLLSLLVVVPVTAALRWNAALQGNAALPWNAALQGIERFQLLDGAVRIAKTFALYGILYYVAFFLNSQIRRIVNPDVKRALRSLVILQFVFFPLIVVEGITDLVPHGTISALFFFLLNILWLRYVSRYLSFPELRLTDLSGALQEFGLSYGISDREREVVAALLDGLSYRMISERLFISYETVKSHVANIYRKAGVKSKMELAALIRKYDT